MYYVLSVAVHLEMFTHSKNGIIKEGNSKGFKCKNMSIGQIIKENFNKDISILIGPEGDFSKVELDNIKSHKNIVESSLGENILKGETASIVASALVKDSLSQC